jgi:hypothetical protein
MVALAVLGTVMGAGQLWGGLYDVRSWGPVAIVAIAAAIALVAVLLLGLTVLTQSRGATLGVAGSLVAVLVVLPGRERRLWLRSSSCSVASGSIWRAGRLLAVDRVDGVAAVAGVGIIAMWVAQTNVDWLHLLPSRTCATVAVAAALLAVKAPRATPSRPPLLVVPVLLLLLVLAAAGVGRLTLAADARRDAEDQLTTAPVQAVALADRALRLQPDDVRSLYVKAAAYAKLDRDADARDTLVEATRAEPSNFVPLVLLGDLALRRGDRLLARQRYLEAQQRNPLDPEIPARLQLTGTT